MWYAFNKCPILHQKTETLNLPTYRPLVKISFRLGFLYLHFIYFYQRGYRQKFTDFQNRASYNTRIK